MFKYKSWQAVILVDVLLPNEFRSQYIHAIQEIILDVSQKMVETGDHVHGIVLLDENVRIGTG